MGDIKADLRHMVGEVLDNVLLQQRLADPSIPIRVRGSQWVQNGEILVAAIPEGWNSKPYTLVLCRPEYVAELEEVLAGYHA